MHDLEKLGLNMLDFMSFFFLANQCTSAALADASEELSAVFSRTGAAHVPAASTEGTVLGF